MPKYTPDDGLLFMLDRYDAIQKIWQPGRKSGMTDCDIRTVLKKIWGEGCGYASPDMGGIKGIAANGAGEPRFYFDSYSWSGKGALQGKPLIEAIRRLLKIPEPGHQYVPKSKQIALF